MSLPPELEFVFGQTSSMYMRTRLISREIVAEDTIALTLERPPGFAFEAGQNTIVSIPGVAEDDLREFSIASAPYEKDIVFAMRMRDSDFKKACYALRPGSALIVRHPAGALWRETTRPQIWLSGGIGITPFRSMIRESLHAGRPFSVTHLHSDRARSTTPFLSEFESYAAKYPEKYQFHLSLTRERAQVSGRLTGQKIATCAPNYLNSESTIIGTTSFVTSMRAELLETGVPPVQIRTERFEGYTG